MLEDFEDLIDFTDAATALTDDTTAIVQTRVHIETSIAELSNDDIADYSEAIRILDEVVAALKDIEPKLGLARHAVVVETAIHG